MLRARRVFSAFLFAALVFTGANAVQAETYELGPFLVYGFGSNDTEAEEDAYGEAWDLIESIEANLPEGHEIVEFVIEDEGIVSPGTYMLEFHLVIEHDLGGLPKGGGPGS